MFIEKQAAGVIRRALAVRGIEVSDETAYGILNDLRANDVPLSKKEMKKARQQYNREASKMFSGYGKQLSERMNELNDVLKPRPKYIPEFAWRWFAGFVIDIKKVEKPLNTQ